MKTNILIFKNFSLLNEKEKIYILRERNSIRIRQNMINQKEICIEDHLEWILSLKDKIDSLYFLVILDDIPIGVVDFTCLDYKEKKAEWGYYVFEKYIGFGAIIQYCILDYFFEELNFDFLYCRVLETNKKVYNNHIKNFFFSNNDIYSEEINVAHQKIHVFGLSLKKSVWIAQRKTILALLNNFFDFNNVKWIS